MREKAEDCNSQDAGRTRNKSRLQGGDFTPANSTTPNRRRKDRMQSFAESDQPPVELSKIKGDLGQLERNLAPNTKANRSGFAKKYMEDDIGLLAIPARVKELRDLQRLRRERAKPVKDSKTGKDFNAAEKWKKAYNKLRPIFRLSRLARQIQLYGSPAYSDAEYHFKSMIKRSKAVTTKISKAEANLPFGMLHPKSRFRMIWSLTLIVLLVYVAFVTPIRIAFSDGDPTNDPVAWQVAENLVNALFMLDILINFFSAYYDDDGNLVSSRSRIACMYLKSWFIIDLISCLPFDYFITSGDQGVKSTQYKDLLKLVRLPRLYRLLKMFKLTKLIKDEKGESNFAWFLELIQMNSSIIIIVQNRVSDVPTLCFRRRHGLLLQLLRLSLVLRNEVQRLVHHLGASHRIGRRVEQQVVPVLDVLGRVHPGHHRLRRHSRLQ